MLGPSSSERAAPETVHSVSKQANSNTTHTFVVGQKTIILSVTTNWMAVYQKHSASDKTDFSKVRSFVQEKHGKSPEHTLNTPEDKRLQTK